MLGVRATCTRAAWVALSNTAERVQGEERGGEGASGELGPSGSRSRIWRDPEKETLFMDLPNRQGKAPLPGVLR